MDSLSIPLFFKRLDTQFDDIPLPSYSTADASGMDVRAALADKLIIPPLSHTIVATNLSVEIPDGFEIQVRPRSGLAATHGVTILNAPGTIDADYRGEIKIILINFGATDFIIERGDRIAQLVLAPVCKAEVRLADELNSTHRNEGGFGHTGVK